MNQEIVFSARDLASGKTLEVAASIETLRNKIREVGGDLPGVRQKTGEVEREWRKLTSGSEFLSEGLQSVRGLLNSIVWGSVIGGAAAGATALFNYAVASRTASIDTEELNKGVLSQAEKFGLIAKSQVELTKTTVALFNSELELAQFREVRDSASRAEKIRQLEEETAASRKKNHEEGLLLEQMREGNPLILTTSVAIAKRSEKVLENAIAVAKLREEDAKAAEILKLKKTTIDQVAAATGKLTDAQLEQEAKGRMILSQALQERKEAGLEQEALGRQALTQAQQVQREQALEQEALGRQILETARKEASEKIALQESLGAAIAHNAKMEYEETKRSEELKTEARLASFSAATSLAEALLTFSHGKSRALFSVWKAAAISQAIVDTYAAANKALASAPPPYNFALAAAVTAAGLANVARISTTQFGGAGGGGGGSVGGAGGGGTPIGGSLREPTPSRVPLEVTVNIHGNVIGQEAWINDELIPSIEEAVRNERSDLALKQK